MKVQDLSSILLPLRGDEDVLLSLSSPSGRICEMLEKVTSREGALILQDADKKPTMQTPAQSFSKIAEILQTHDEKEKQRILRALVIFFGVDVG